MLNLKPMHWKQAGSPPLKKFKLSPSAGKVMLVAFCDSHGIILALFMQKGQTLTARYYSEVHVVLKKLEEKLNKMHPRLAQKMFFFCMKIHPLILSPLQNLSAPSSGHCCFTLSFSSDFFTFYLFPELK